MENVPRPEEAVLNVFQDTIKQKIQCQDLDIEGDENQAKDITIPYIDETLGYMLKYELEQMENVVFCGIKNPHPLMHQMIFRIVTKNNFKVTEAFKLAMNETNLMMLSINEFNYEIIRFQISDFENFTRMRDIMKATVDYEVQIMKSTIQSKFEAEQVQRNKRLQEKLQQELQQLENEIINKDKLSDKILKNQKLLQQILSEQNAIQQQIIQLQLQNKQQENKNKEQYQNLTNIAQKQLQDNQIKQQADIESFNKLSEVMKERTEDQKQKYSRLEHQLEQQRKQQQAELQQYDFTDLSTLKSEYQTLIKTVGDLQQQFDEQQTQIQQLQQMLLKINEVNEKTKNLIKQEQNLDYILCQNNIDLQEEQLVYTI